MASSLVPASGIKKGLFDQEKLLYHESRDGLCVGLGVEVWCWLFAEPYLLTVTTAGWASEFQQASKSLASGSPSVTMKR